MSDREELVEIIGEHFKAEGDPTVTAGDIIAAGFHRDRTITTAEELGELPDWSVVLDADSEVWQRQSGIWLDTDGRAARSSALVRIFGPVTVLHEGGRDE